MLFGACYRVAHGGLHLDDEGPVGGLREHEFAAELFERWLPFGALSARRNSLGHPLLRGVERRVDPGVARVEPDREIARLAPAGVGRFCDLLHRVAGEIVGRGRCGEGAVAGDFAKDGVEEERPLEPPVAKEFGVVGRGDDGAHRRALRGPGDLGGAGCDEVAGMLGDRGHRCLRVVGLLLGLGTRGDAVILEPRVHADAVGVDEGGHLFERPVEAHIAVVFAVAEVAGVALVRRPDLARRLGVAAEEGDAARREQRGNEATQRPVGGTLDGVAVDKGEAHAGLGKQPVDASGVGAFAHPHAGGGEAAARLEGACGGANLATPAAIEEHERQEAVRAHAGDELDAPALVQPDETADEVALQAVQVEVAEPDEAGEVEAGHGAEVCVGLGAGDLLRREPDEAGEVLLEAVAEEAIVEHADERLREREGNAAGDAIAVESL